MTHISRFAYFAGKETKTALTIPFLVKIQTPPPTFEAILSFLKTQ
jgi:hypothetical protein